MEDNIQIIKEQNRHAEEIQKNTINAVRDIALTTAGVALAAYGTKKILGANSVDDEAIALGAELLDAW